MKQFLIAAALALISIFAAPQNPPGSYGPGTGGSGVGNPTNAASPAIGWYLGPFCPISNTGQCVFTPANTQVDNTATWASNSTTITTTDSPFSAADATNPAKYIFGTGGGIALHSGCNPYEAASAKVLMTTTHLTINLFTDANHVVVNATPGTTFSVAGQGCVVWGTTDDTGAANLWTLLDAAASCPRMTFLGGYYLFTTPPRFMYDQPTACFNHPNVFAGTGPHNGTDPYGNTALASGFHIEGRGIGATTLFVPPDFPETGACNHGPGTVLTNNACFSVQAVAEWEHFSINGAGGATTGPSSGSILTIGVGSLHNFLCAGFANRFSVTGVLVQNLARLDQVNISGCGGDGLELAANTGTIWASSNIPTTRLYWVWVENNVHSNILVDAGANASFKSLQLEGTQDTSTGINAILNNGGTLWLDDVDATQLTGDNGTVPAMNAYNCNTGPCVLHCDHCRFGLSSVATLTRGVFVTAGQVSTVFAHDSIFNSTGTGKSYVDNGSTASADLTDLGGLQIVGQGASITGTNSRFHHRETGTCTFAASTTCTVTFGNTFGTSTPTFLIPPNIPATATTLTVSALSASAATITASASNSSSVNWQAILQ